MGDCDDRTPGADTGTRTACDAAWAVTHRLTNELRALTTDDETTRLLDRLSDAIGDLVVAAEDAVLDHLVIGYRPPGCAGVSVWKETAPTAYDPELDYEAFNYRLRVLGAPYEELVAAREERARRHLGADGLGVPC